jgi:hypothetical protein
MRCEASGLAATPEEVLLRLGAGDAGLIAVVEPHRGRRRDRGARGLALPTWHLGAGRAARAVGAWCPPETVARRRAGLARPWLVHFRWRRRVWWVLLRPTAEFVAPTVVTVCNGSAALCDRRVDDVVFPAAHNAQSNVDSPDWMFPHHQAGIQTMLRDGVRAFAIDIHYGFAGGARIKTDLAGLSAAKLTEAVGEEAAQIAERIRNTLVGADEGKRDLYFCHGFCELGAYDPRSSFRAIREFMVANPDEVVILIIEECHLDIGPAFEERSPVWCSRVLRPRGGPPSGN